MLLKENPETKHVSVTEGVAAMKDGKFYGCQYADGQITEMSFGPLKNANISDPKFCKRPEDMTYSGSIIRPLLQKSKLVKVRKTVTIELLND